jgi:hypothetical protein
MKLLLRKSLILLFFFASLISLYEKHIISTNYQKKIACKCKHFVELSEIEIPVTDINFFLYYGSEIVFYLAIFRGLYTCVTRSGI